MAAISAGPEASSCCRLVGLLWMSRRVLAAHGGMAIASDQRESDWEGQEAEVSPMKA
jgi:hypothetical protein